jgi:hypothetical protein
VIYVITGRRFLGKSTLAAAMVRDARFNKRVIVDPRFQWATSDPIGTLPGDSSELWARLQDPSTIEVVIQPDDDVNGTADQLASILREALTNDPALRLVILIDESHLIEDSPRWDWLARCAGWDTTYLIFTTHRPQDVPTSIRALIDRWCVFQTTQEHDLDVIHKRMGEDVRDLVQALPPYYFVEWNDAKRTYVTHENPAAWYRPLGDGAPQLAAAGR